MTCNCEAYDAMTDITPCYSDFTSKLKVIAYGDWVKLMHCEQCLQYWKVDEWDKYQTLYATKIVDTAGWKEFDNAHLVKQKMVQNRDDQSHDRCMWQACSQYAVNGSAYCVDHLYDTGTRS